MTREARLTQKRLEGEIEKLLEGESATVLASDVTKCSFCHKYADIEKREEDHFSGLYYNHLKSCGNCPVLIGLGCRCYSHRTVIAIDSNMCDAMWVREAIDKAIPGALAIHLWLYEL